MTEESTEVTEITPEQIESAKALLTSDAVGLNVFDAPALDKRLARERKGPERDLEALRQKMETLETSHSELKTYRQEIEDKGKTDLEKLQGQVDQGLESKKTMQADVDRLRSERDGERTKSNEFHVNLKVRKLLTNSLNDEIEDVAVMLVHKQLPGLSVSESGVLVFTEPDGDRHEGPAAEKVVSDWWGSKQDLQRAKSAGPDTKGNPKSPPNNSTEYKPLPESADLQDRIAHAQAWNAQNQG